MEELAYLLSVGIVEAGVLVVVLVVSLVDRVELVVYEVEGAEVVLFVSKVLEEGVFPYVLILIQCGNAAILPCGRS